MEQQLQLKISRFERMLMDGIEGTRLSLESQGHANAIHPMQTARNAWRDRMVAHYGLQRCLHTLSFQVIASQRPHDNGASGDDFPEDEGATFVRDLEKTVLRGIKE